MQSLPPLRVLVLALTGVLDLTVVRNEVDVVGHVAVESRAAGDNVSLTIDREDTVVAVTTV